MRGTVLVTGGTGFVGSHLVPALVDQHWNVRIVSRRATERFSGISGVEEIIAGDFLKVDDWRPYLDGVEAVVHLAARVHVMKDAAADPLHEFMRANRDVTLTLARQAAELKLAKFVFLSSIKVNGEETPAGEPFTVDSTPDPRDPYGVSKLAAEHGLRDLHAESGMAVTIIRPPLIYGPGVAGNFARIIKLARTGLPLPLGSATGSRSLLYVGNLVSYIVGDLANSDARVNLALLADAETLSTRELVRLLRHEMGMRSRLLKVPPAMMEFGARLTGFRQEFQRLFHSLEVSAGSSAEMTWQPPYSVNQGLAQTVTWYLSER